MPPSGGGLTFYLDGAHTRESIKQCAKWFASVSGPSEGAGANGSNVQQPDSDERAAMNVMFFYTMEKRDPFDILAPLHQELQEKVSAVMHEAIGCY